MLSDLLCRPRKYKLSDASNWLPEPEHIVRLSLRAVQFQAMSELIEGEDFYWEGPYMVFTAQYHLRKGQCCGSGCRHCPYEPRGMKGTTKPAAQLPVVNSPPPRPRRQ